MKEVNVDSNRATKTMIRIIFFFLAISAIFSFFSIHYFKIFFWIGFVILILQIIMDWTEDYMNQRYGSGKWGVKNKYLTGKLN